MRRRLIARFLKVAGLAKGARRLLFRLAQLFHADVRIVAIHAFEREMLALVQLFVLLVVINKAGLGINLGNVAAAMALTT